MMLWEIDSLTITCPEDARCVLWAHSRIKARKELDSYFNSTMTEDRAYALGMIASGGDENVAKKYVLGLHKAKADKYGKSQ